MVMGVVLSVWIQRYPFEMPHHDARFGNDARRELDEEKLWLADHTNSQCATGQLAEVLDGADMFIGVMR
jgi:hypothetical protein